MEEHLRKKFRSDPTFNPFGDGFEPRVVIEELKRFSDEFGYNDKSSAGIIETGLSALQLNIFYKDIYDVLKKRIVESYCTTTDLTQQLIASVNRQYLIINQLQEERTSDSGVNFADLFKQKINSSDPTIGKLDLGSAMETEIDSLNITLNHLRHFEGKTNEDYSKDEIKYVETIRALSTFGTMFYVIKHCFEDCVWNEGYMGFTKQKSEYEITYKDSDCLILNKIGFYRLQRNSQGTFLQNIEAFNKFKFDDQNTEFFSRTKSNQKIKSAWTKDGLIDFELTIGRDESENEWEILNQSHIDAYYNFIDDVPLPKLTSLSLNDVICVFTIIQHLIRKISRQYIDDDSVYERKDFNKFPVKMSYSKLKTYLSLRTTYNDLQIDDLLGLFINPTDKRINLWSYPFLKLNNELFIPLLTIEAPLMYVLIDRWLEDGGYNIDKRGVFFEKHIKNALSGILKRKGFSHIIPKKPKIFIKGGKYEEIDLLLNLKKVVLIAEVKCIKYPLEVRDHHNALGRLKHGTEQVIRKANFIADNANEVEAQIGIIKDKPIVKIVITNYPNFVGMNINGIAIVDFYLLESYISTGKLTSHKITFDEGVIGNEVTDEIKLYLDEDSFCDNLERSLYYPKAIEEVRPFIELVRSKITPGNLNFQIYVEAAEFKSEYNIPEKG